MGLRERQEQRPEAEKSKIWPEQQGKLLVTGDMAGSPADRKKDGEQPMEVSALLKR